MLRIGLASHKDYRSSLLCIKLVIIILEQNLRANEFLFKNKKINSEQLFIIY